MDELQLQIQNGNTYLTHGYHPYPCKFIPKLPRSIINKYTKQGDWVLDPFSGSGTTLVEATILSRNGVGIDLNPVAALSTRVKTTALKESDIDQIRSIMEKITLLGNVLRSYFLFCFRFSKILEMTRSTSLLLFAFCTIVSNSPLEI